MGILNKSVFPYEVYLSLAGADVSAARRNAPQVKEKYFVQQSITIHPTMPPGINHCVPLTPIPGQAPAPHHTQLDKTTPL